MKLFGASFTAILVRFYIMMAVVILAVFIGPIWLAALALPLFLSALLGPAFIKAKRVKRTVRHSNLVPSTSV